MLLGERINKKRRRKMNKKHTDEEVEKRKVENTKMHRRNVYFSSLK